MRNYIILNGVNSNTLSGLIIQELPPITKPKIRTQVEEIDGRDGDIVTALGYEAYDKELSIGLYGNFNIDNIIKYFNSSGTVTFSNESTKYYNYQIVDQIDFDRLVRYRTAKVKMHIQPFKYSTSDNSRTFTTSSIQITNAGNIYSKPKITITGEDDIAVSLNGTQIFEIELGTNGSIVIDTDKMEAYNGTTLLNRIVTGNYDNFKLNVGSNTISLTGTVTQTKIENYSRWI